MQLEGNIVDVIRKEIYPGKVTYDECITSVEETIGTYDTYICPGYIDPHIHIESTMLAPSSFAEIAAAYGTTAVVADPHEIANVMGMEGIRYMMDDANQAKIDIYFTAPSCVPATPFETSGATLGPDDIDQLLSMDNVVALGEMMNYPGVLAGDPDCMAKIAAAKRHGKPIDGHCPALSGENLKKYVAAGISTEHECTTLEEAREKAAAGMKIFIREGSSARNLKALIGLEDAFAFCTDDRNFMDLYTRGHINGILAEAVREGKDPIDALRMSTINPATHYAINSGAIEEGRRANMLVLRDLKTFVPESTICGGEYVASRKKFPGMVFPHNRSIGKMNARMPTPDDIAIPEGWQNHCIGVRDGQLVTDHLYGKDHRGWQKLVVVDRYTGTYVSACNIKGFGLHDCALAQTIAHDSHNIIAVGSDDNSLMWAINNVIINSGGISVVCGTGQQFVPLHVAGLMNSEWAAVFIKYLRNIQTLLEESDCQLSHPITTLSFMALPVIPNLKLTDRGLFDVETFSFIPRELP